MNRHRAHWSAMGQEPSTEKSQRHIDFEEFENQLKDMFAKYDSVDVLTTVRRVYEEENK